MRWVIRGGIALVVLLVIGAGLVFFVIIPSKMKGPDSPVCAITEPRRATFARPSQISGPSSPGARTYDTEPTAALLPDGTLAIAYNVRDPFYRSTSGLATATVSLNGETEVRAYETDRAEAFDAWMAAGPDGKIRLVWLAHDGGRPEKNMKVGFAESNDGRAWSRPGTAHAPADCPAESRGCMDKPMIAVGKDAIYVFYYSEASEGLRLTRTRLNSPRFETSVQAGTGAYADVDLAPSGALHVAFVSGRNQGALGDRYGDSRNAVFYTRSDDGGKTFTRETPVSNKAEGIPFFFSNAQVSADEARNLVYIAYPAGTPDGRWTIKLATSRDRGASWTTVDVNDDPPCASHMTPHTALDPLTGKLHISWLENRGGKGALAYSACEMGGAKCGQNERISEAAFASYGYERHLPAWLGEYGALVFDAARRRLHAVWTQPVDEDGEAISRIFHAVATLPAE